MNETNRVAKGLVRVGVLQEDLGTLVQRLPWDLKRTPRSDENVPAYYCFNGNPTFLMMISRSQKIHRDWGYNCIFSLASYSEKENQRMYEKFCEIANVEFREPPKEMTHSFPNMVNSFERFVSQMSG